jgi:hypothetical protein
MICRVLKHRPRVTLYVGVKGGSVKKTFSRLYCVPASEKFPWPIYIHHQKQPKSILLSVLFVL